MFKFDNSLEVSERISKRYLELPQSYDLSELEIKKIVNIITDNKININLLSKINKLKR
jgi:dTDP-4-amino-4,6-dideoxygalactose transaminase